MLVRPTRASAQTRPPRTTTVPIAPPPDQQVLYIERLPDTVQTDHIDWGFRIAQLYGQDYRYTTIKGILFATIAAKESPEWI